MQAYCEEELIPCENKENCYELKFYGDNFNYLWGNKKYNEFLSEKLNELIAIKNKIKERSSKEIIISGGEPLLQRQALINIFNFCKKNKIKTGIITNASKPKVLESLLKQGIVDTIIVDLRTSKEDFKKITRTGTFFESSEEIYSKILKSLKILEKYDKEVTIIFRTTVIPGYVFRKEVFIDIAGLIKNINSVWELKRFIALENSMFSNINPASEAFMEAIKEIVEKDIKKSNVILE